jgi:hypothetical protein
MSSLKMKQCKIVVEANEYTDRKIEPTKYPMTTKRHVGRMGEVIYVFNSEFIMMM